MRFIKKTSEYRDIYREHQKVQGNYFTVLYCLNGEVEEPSVGIVIRSRVGKAVVRNKLKRRIRAYLHQHSEQITSGVSAVIIARNNASEANWEDINRDLDDCFSLIGQNS
jgi:ribonuclease P protein component